MRTLRRLATEDSDLSATEIVVAELLTNALAHTTGPAWVNLSWDGEHPLLSVADVGSAGTRANTTRAQVDADRTLVPRLPDDPLAEGGRGLFLVAHFALDVAVAPRATGGTIVSVTLDLARAGTLSV
jgi:anti-sigma regulatory factor (Ser/Thr protein kinase)